MRPRGRKASPQRYQQHTIRTPAAHPTNVDKNGLFVDKNNLFIGKFFVDEISPYVDYICKNGKKVVTLHYRNKEITNPLRTPPQGYADRIMTTTLFNNEKERAGRRVQGTRKAQYYIFDDTNNRIMAAEKQYTNDLAISWALLILKRAKAEDPNLMHATLYKRTSKYKETKIQGFYRAD